MAVPFIAGIVKAASTAVKIAKGASIKKLVQQAAKTTIKNIALKPIKKATSWITEPFTRAFSSVKNLVSTGKNPFSPVTNIAKQASNISDQLQDQTVQNLRRQSALDKLDIFTRYGQNNPESAAWAKRLINASSKMSLGQLEEGVARINNFIGYEESYLQQLANEQGYASVEDMKMGVYSQTPVARLIEFDDQGRQTISTLRPKDWQ